MPTVYLAGPITGLSWGESTDWRDQAAASLAAHHIRGVSPLRRKDYLKNESAIAADYPGHVMSGQRGIMTRDHFDVMHCDLVLANLTADKVSVGTVMEIAWAFAYKKPVVAVMPEGCVHDHPMVREAVGFRVGTVAEAVEVVRAILEPYA